MNTDTVKKIGGIQEQIEMEHRARRAYPRKWLKFYQEVPWKDMYNQNEINKQLKADLKDYNPFIYTNEGDSYFVSAEMYKSLMAVCRCGRPRSGLHLLKCLQNERNKYQTKTSDETNERNDKFRKIPETSTGFVGWHSEQLNNYKQWEKSMKYVSPLYDMPGGRVTNNSYDVLMIG